MTRRIAVLFGALAATGAFAFGTASHPAAPARHSVVANDAGPESASNDAAV